MQLNSWGCWEVCQQHQVFGTVTDWEAKGNSLRRCYIVSLSLSTAGRCKHKHKYTWVWPSFCNFGDHQLESWHIVNALLTVDLWSCSAWSVPGIVWGKTQLCYPSWDRPWSVCGQITSLSCLWNCKVEDSKHCCALSKDRPTHHFADSNQFVQFSSKMHSHLVTMSGSLEHKWVFDFFGILFQMNDFGPRNRCTVLSHLTSLALFKDTLVGVPVWSASFRLSSELRCRPDNCTVTAWKSGGSQSTCSNQVRFICGV